MDQFAGSPWTRSVVWVRVPGVSVFGLPRLLAIFITLSKSSLGRVLFIFGVNDFSYLKILAFRVFLLQKVSFIALLCLLFKVMRLSL